MSIFMLSEEQLFDLEMISPKWEEMYSYILSVSEKSVYSDMDLPTIPAKSQDDWLSWWCQQPD